MCRLLYVPRDRLRMCAQEDSELMYIPLSALVTIVLAYDLVGFVDWDDDTQLFQCNRTTNSFGWLPSCEIVRALVEHLLGVPPAPMCFTSLCWLHANVLQP